MAEGGGGQRTPPSANSALEPPPENNDLSATQALLEACSRTAGFISLLEPAVYAGTGEEGGHLLKEQLESGRSMDGWQVGKGGGGRGWLRLRCSTWKREHRDSPSCTPLLNSIAGAGLWAKSALRTPLPFPATMQPSRVRSLAPGRGLGAARSVEGGGLVLSVPEELLLSVRTARRDAELAPLLTAADEGGAASASAMLPDAGAGVADGGAATAAAARPAPLTSEDVLALHVRKI